MALAPESLSWCSSSRAVYRGLVLTTTMPGAQHAEQRDRVLQDVRHHQGDAVARREPGFVLQPGGERRG